MNRASERDPLHNGRNVDIANDTPICFPRKGSLHYDSNKQWIHTVRSLSKFVVGVMDVGSPFDFTTILLLSLFARLHPRVNEPL
jgi:hypothetical protein